MPKGGAPGQRARKIGRADLAVREQLVQFRLLFKQVHGWSPCLQQAQRLAAPSAAGACLGWASALLLPLVARAPAPESRVFSRTASTTERKRKRPSVPPSAASPQRSGCGIIAATLPR